MALPRFFCPIDLEKNSSIVLPPDVANHAGRALRLKEGSRVSLFNGKGGEFHGVLRFPQGTATVDIDHYNPENRSLRGNITLIQALASGDKMDWIIEKAVEIGVTQFIPLAAKRSILQLSGSRLEKRQQHWQAIVQSASEQSGRNQLMHLQPLQTLGSVFSLLKNTHILIADPNAEQTLGQYLSAHPSLHDIGFFIGPEGGWSEEEHQLMNKHQAIHIQFGNRILRTETAGLALCSASSALLNW